MSERSGPMVILAVHIIGDGAADSDELSARHHRQKPAVRHYQTQDLGEQYARFARNPARLAVEANDSIERAREDEPAPDIEAAIAVAASLTEGQHGLDDVRG